MVSEHIIKEKIIHNREPIGNQSQKKRSDNIMSTTCYEQECQDKHNSKGHPKSNGASFQTTKLYNPKVSEKKGDMEAKCIPHFPVQVSQLKFDFLKRYFSNFTKTF